MTRTCMREADLTGVFAGGVDLRSAVLNGATIRAANLSGAILRGASLIGTDLSLSDLVGADLSEAQLDQVVLDGIRHDETTRWPDDFSPPSSGGLDDHD